MSFNLRVSLSFTIDNIKVWPFSFERTFLLMKSTYPNRIVVLRDFTPLDFK